ELHFRKSLEISQRLASERLPRESAEVYYKLDLADTYMMFANLYRDFGDLTAAMPWHDKAVATLEAVFEKETVGVNKRPLRNALWYRARTLHNLGRHAHAIKEWDRVIELSPPGEKARPRINRAVALAASGQVNEALAEVAAVLKSPDLEPSWYSLACVYSVASAKVPEKQREYADRAMKYLRTLSDSGWQYPESLKKDPDFDAIRDRDDFKKLVAELEQTAPPPREVRW
ncbi:MAG TPA: tetratricopeptide repeat protein, partial [Gemmataceae bacterium]|nr:tetratricopeptide repeat protein [Gemmataceae bacterium]